MFKRKGGLFVLYSEEALVKIQLRTEALPERATSTTCRSGEIPSIVRSIYKNVPTMFGRFAGRDLPDWMTNDDLFVFGKETSPRGGVAPVYFVGLSGVESQSAATLPKLALMIVPAVPAAGTFLTVSPFTFSGLSLDSKADAQTTSALASESQRRPVIALIAIRWRQRVGIFDGDRLIVCFTKRHYRAHGAVDLLAQRPEYAGIDLRLYTPHLAAQMRYREAIQTATHVLVSSSALGAKSTHAEKLAVWEAKRGNQCDASGDWPPDVSF